MQPFLFFLALSLFLAGCQEQREPQTDRWEKMRQQPPGYRVVRIEGCEYLRFETTHSYGVLTHKGNCDNPIHCYRDTTQNRPVVTADVFAPVDAPPVSSP